jgi:hypothetical protein
MIGRVTEACTSAIWVSLPLSCTIIQADPTLWITEATGRRTGGVLTATSDLLPPPGAPFVLDRSALRITVLGQGAAVEIAGCPAD